MENVKSGQLFEGLQTTASNLVNPSDNNIVEKGCDDIVYIDFEGWFY